MAPPQDCLTQEFLLLLVHTQPSAIPQNGHLSVPTHLMAPATSAPGKQILAVTLWIH